MLCSYLIPIGERVGDEGRDLVDELVGLPGVEDPGEPAHVFAAGRPPRLLEPVVHDAALPRVVHRPRRGHRCVERPQPLAGGGGAEAAGGGGGGSGGGCGEGGGQGKEAGVGGEERVVGEQHRRYRHQDQRQRAAAARRGHGVWRERASLEVVMARGIEPEVSRRVLPSNRRGQFGAWRRKALFLLQSTCSRMGDSPESL